jgi:hypothetical protein
MNPAQEVFDSAVLVHKILSELDYPEVYALYGTNRTFFSEAKPMYTEQYRTKKDRFNQIYGRAMSEYRKALNMRDKFVSSTMLMVNILEHNLWPFLLENPYMSENLFMLWTEMHRYSKMYANCSKLLDINYNDIRSNMGSYIHFDSVSDFTVLTMRRLVAFKGVRGAYAMSKSKLVGHLKRKKDQLYYWH